MNGRNAPGPAVHVSEGAGGNGRISTDKPAADEPPDHYLYDPANPVPSRGGHSCCTPDVAPVGPANQADVEGRADVLVYSAPTLDHAVEVTGPVSLTLYASSSAVDTDWTAKLVDVFPGEQKALDIAPASLHRVERVVRRVYSQG